MIPQIQKTLLGYLFEWIEERITIEVRHLKFTHDSLKGEVNVKTSLPGYNPHVHQANFNFSSTRAKAELTKTLYIICKEIEWAIIIEQLRVKALELYRQGDPLIFISPNKKVKGPEYLLYPFLPKNQMSLVYGEGGTGKSTMALFFTLLLMCPSISVEYVLKTETSRNILYLDYETDEDTIQWQFSNLASVFECGKEIFYRRCNIPLTQDIEKIKECAYQSQADLVIVDSVGIACGDNINDAHTANSLALALRSLNTTNLLISHTSKEKTDRKTPFGSIYFFNNARNVWELKKIQEAGENEINLGLFHRKSNISKLSKPYGFKFIYEEDAIIVKKEDVTEVDEFLKELSISARIKKLLASEGVMDIKDISESINAPIASVRVMLNRMKKKGETIKKGDSWALLYQA